MSPAGPDLESHARLGAAFSRGPVAVLRAAADDFLADGATPTQLRAALRFLQLFYGVPRVIRALHLLDLPPAADTPVPPPAEDPRAAGEAAFRRVYGEDADRVLLVTRGSRPKRKAS